MRPVRSVRLTAVIIGAAYSVVLWLTGVSVPSPYKEAITLFPAVAVLGLQLWDTWLWRTKVCRWLHHRPDIRGLWRASIQPTEESRIPTQGNRGPIPAYLMIRQDFWSVSVRQYTAESTSESRAFFWQFSTGSDTERLTFIYANTPQQVHQHRSNPHVGTCTLDPVGQVPQQLSGGYVTDRYTKGDMRLHLVDRSRFYADFEDADRHAASRGRRRQR